MEQWRKGKVEGGEERRGKVRGGRTDKEERRRGGEWENEGGKV